MSAGDTWRLRPGQAVRYRHWDEECVLYNDLSGDTHLLGDAALELLLTLQHGPTTEVMLAAVLKAEFDIDEDELAGETAALLQHMNHLYLIETLAC